MRLPDLSKYARILVVAAAVWLVSTFVFVMSISGNRLDLGEIAAYLVIGVLPVIAVCGIYWIRAANGENRQDAPD